MPLPTQGANASSTTDYEQLGYDAASNVTSRRLRDASTIAFAYDNLDRVTLKDLPGSEPDVSYAYDNLSRLTSATQTGNALTFTYDALSRNLTQVGPQGSVASQWDLAGRRTRLTYPGSGLYVDYDYLVTNEMTAIRENGATSGVGVLATLAYDDLGRRTGLMFGNGASQAYGYDPVSRLASLTNDLSGTANDLSQTFAYNPASQIASTVRTGDAYAWTGAYAENRNYSANGLNQYIASGAITPTYDGRGNLTSAGTTTYTYSSENMLTSASGGTSASLGYDPALRLYQLTSGASTTRFAYDGVDLIAEYDGSNNLLRRHVFGPGTDEAIVWYEGSGTSDRRFLGSDERGSIVSVTDGNGALLAIDSYDEYGIPGTANIGRFQYTGQAWLPELGMQHSKARIYSPTLGRFLQTDPIGYGDGMNIYAYTGNDPVNGVDPLGLDGQLIIVTAGWRMKANEAIAYLTHALNLGTPGADNDDHQTITVRGKRKGRKAPAPVRAWSWGHNYKPLHRVSNSNCNLTATEEAFLVQHFATPFEPGKQAVEGRVDLFGYNPIQQSITNNGLAVINVTLPGHFFNSDEGGGRVVRAIVRGTDGAIYSSTVGMGTNYSQARAGANQLFGPMIFAWNDIAMGDYIAESGICN